MRSNKYLYLSTMLLSLFICSHTIADEGEKNLPAIDDIALLDSQLNTLPTRGYLSVPSSVSASCDTINMEIVTQGLLGNTTTNFCKSKIYKLLSPIFYKPAATNSCPMIRITASGVNFDLCHSYMSFCRNACETHCIGIEVGYSPQAIEDDPGLEGKQPTSVVIENGIMANWDIAILVHHGVQNITIRNMVFTGNVLPVVVLGKNNTNGTVDEPVVSVHLENVSILGSCSEFRACLLWIKSKLSNGNDFGYGSTLTGSYGYDDGEVPYCVCDPIANVREMSPVYSGLYMYGTSDVRMKNVHVANIGFSGNIGGGLGEPSVLSERTATYGMWFRNSKSIFMEDVASVKNKSSLGVAGVVFEQSELISVKKGNFSCNTITQQELTHANPDCCPDGMWAAGMVLKDSRIGSFCDIVLSDNRGIDNAWGVRTILSAIYDNTNTATEVPQLATVRPTIDIFTAASGGWTFENAYADGLRADRVYAYDFGDIYRTLVTSFATDVTGTSPTAQAHPTCTALPAGAAEKVTLKNVTACGAAGKIVGDTVEAKIAKEFKGIYLGDGSSGIVVDGARIESNHVVLDATGVSREGLNSGIEWGDESTIYIFAATAGIDNDLEDFGAAALAATGKAEGSLTDARFNEVRIGSNTGGSDFTRFVGFRVVSTGTNDTHAAGVNRSSDITITNTQVSENQFDGFRAVDDSAGDAPIILSSLTMDHVGFNNSLDGYGFNVDEIVSSTIKHAQFNLNKERGFNGKRICSLDVINSEFNENNHEVTNLLPGQDVANVYGFDVNESATCLTFEGVKFSSNRAVDANVAGLHVETGKSVTLKNSQANCNVSSRDVQDGPFTTRGLYFETEVQNLGLYDVTANSNVANHGDAYGMQIDRATSLHAENVQANNNQAEGAQATNGNVSQAVGMFFKATVGAKNSEGCIMKHLQACGNRNAHLAYGIYMQEPIGITIDTIDGSSNIADATGQIDGLPVLNQAIGVFLEGGFSVHISNLHASANHQLELEAQNLSRYLEKGNTALDSEANCNLSNEIAHHFAVANRSGSYGLLALDTQDVSIEHGTACKNKGVRAFGIHGRGSDNMLLHNVDTLDNHALGTPFISDNPFNLMNPTTLDTTTNAGEVDPEAVEVPDVQAECHFGGINPAATIDLKKAFEEYLKALMLHKGSITSSSTCEDPCGDNGDTIGRCLPAYLNVIWGAIACYRRFCTAAGIGLYNCSFASIEKCRAIGNYADCDSAGGIVMYGKGEGHVITNCVAANNECWKASERGGPGTFHIDGDIDFSKWHTLYNFLDVGLLDSENIATTPDEYGFVVLPTSVIKASHIDEDTPPTPAPQRKPTNLTQPDSAAAGALTWILNTRAMTVGILPTGNALTGNAINLYDFASVGPIGVGILLECQRDCQVNNNNAYGNKGHAGLGFGIFADAASSSMFIDNQAISNSADILGYAWGFADFSLSTPNVWYKNWMFANRVDTFMNSSHFIQFDVTKSAGQQLPLKTIFPGSTETLINALPFDNIIVRFNNERQEYDCVGDMMTNKWISTDVIN